MLEPRIAGTRDYVHSDASAFQLVRGRVDAAMLGFGYAPIDPPILERAEPFLDRSGEEIRRRMYIFQDPQGRELCLRPELTIPVCRAYLRHLESGSGSAQMSLEREARLSYMGPAFRYESTSEGRYRQFNQGGAEMIGAQRREAADAEILALAVDTLERVGITGLDIQIGDIGIAMAFIDGLPIGDRTKARLRRFTLRGRRLPQSTPAAPQPTVPGPGADKDLADLASFLGGMAPNEAEYLIREVLALADIQHVGGRTRNEIVERLIARTSGAAAENVSEEVLKGLGALLDIHASPEAASDSIRRIFDDFGLDGAEPLLDRCAERLMYFNAYFATPPALRFNAGLRRGLEYYTGFVFEIYGNRTPWLGQLCGGGRYDNLLEALGARLATPAVGFGVGIDRLVLAMQAQQDPDLSAKLLSPDAMVVGAGAVLQEQCIRVSRELRAAGWSVETETSGRRPASALRHAIRRQISYMVFVGEEEMKTDTVRIRRLQDRDEHLVPVPSIRAFVAHERLRPASDEALS